MPTGMGSGRYTRVASARRPRLLRRASQRNGEGEGHGFADRLFHHPAVVWSCGGVHSARFHSTVQDALMTPQRHVLDAPWQRGRAGGYRLPRRGTSRSLR
jgi:hypothetical protein